MLSNTLAYHSTELITALKYFRLWPHVTVTAQVPSSKQKKKKSEIGQSLKTKVLPFIAKALETTISYQIL
jgi:hypothetical protein